MASTTSSPAYLSSGVPVQQPPHLEGDASLATEILPGPPSLASAQQSVLKRDPRKPSTAYSYLPPSDPGSTYSGIMHGTLIGHEHEASPSKRPKNTTGRAQRASARSQNGSMTLLDPSVETELVSASIFAPLSVDVEPYTMVVDDGSSISRSNSLVNVQDGISANSTGRARRKDKGKAKETAESSIVRVKEEPQSISLHSPEPPINANDDHCSSCRSHGALVYCDGCPRAFHLWCLDPPMENVDEGDSRWFCPSCMIRKHPPRKPPPSLLSPLIQQVDNTIPTEFQLPEDVRTFFKDVTTGPKGTYMDSSEMKQPRLNRHGQLEDRDPLRLKDRNGAPVLCFRCGTSALPGSLAAVTVPATKRARKSSTKAATPEAWKSIISCDYCDLHWHLDCLDPPLPTMPPFTRKWMCPVHAEQVIPPKRRLPKQNVPIEIVKPRQFNNGNIEIIHPETARATENVDKVFVDEVLINGRRYRVPERVVILDFWNKLNRAGVQLDKDFQIWSGMSSPLTSLSSLDESEERLLPGLSLPFHDPEDIKVAQLLCNLHSSRISVAAPSSTSTINGFTRKTVDHGIQTEPEHVLPVRTKDLMQPQKIAIPKRPSPKPRVNGSTGAIACFPSDSVGLPSESTPSTAKRKKSARSVQPEPNTRELRSRSKNNADSSLTSISSRSSVRRVDDAGRESLPVDSALSAPLTSTSFGKSRSFQIKVEELESGPIFGSSSSFDTGLVSVAPIKSTLKRARAPRRVMQKVVGDPRPDEREKKGRKRKERDDDLPSTEERNRPEMKEKEKEKEKEKKDRQKKKVVRTPSRQGYLPPAASTTPASVPPSISIPVTPSLKIRLPRLGNVNNHHSSPAMLNASGDSVRL